MKFKWDKWQQQVLDHKGNITMRCGRQVGKSEVVSKKIADFAIDHPNSVILIIAASDRQSKLIFEKTKGNLDIMITSKNPIFKEPPTLHKILLLNGTQILSLPAGRTGYFIRGYTIDLLIVDEAAYVPPSVFNSIIPALAVTQKLRGTGIQILLSTPFGKGGYFWDSFFDNDFRQFHISAEDCPRYDKKFLAKEKKRLPKIEYAQEYLAEFIDDWHQFFATKLIKSCMDFIYWTRDEDYKPFARYYLGVDIARYGGDENAFVICELDKTNLKIIKVITTERVSTTDTIGRIQYLDRIWNFNKIFVDDSGLGGTVLDILLENIGRKVMGLNNARKRVLVQGEERKKGIFKEDLYSNTLMLMETGKLKLISNLGLLKSMKSITYEYGESKYDVKVKIFGDYSHITEALVRACWCIKERGLSLYIY